MPDSGGGTVRISALNRPTVAILAVVACVGFSTLAPVPARTALGQDDVVVAPPPDPALPGPYAVGVTRRVFARPSSVGAESRVLNAIVWYPAVTSSDGASPPLGRVLAEP